jgi:acyl carrier protein
MSESELEELMLGILERELGARIGAEENIYEHGIDSHQLIRFVVDVEEACGISLDMEDALEYGTVRSIIRSLNESMDKSGIDDLCDVILLASLAGAQN